MRFLLGLFLGLGFGVFIGLLFAPQSGEVTRAQLGECGIQLCPEHVAKDIQARTQEALVQGKKHYNRTKAELTERYACAKSGDFS